MFFKEAIKRLIWVEQSELANRVQAVQCNNDLRLNKLEQKLSSLQIEHNALQSKVDVLFLNLSALTAKPEKSTKVRSLKRCK